ncbi:MAG: PH domain-containing protein [Candidatus Limnocylindrales bacterium]
MGTYAESLLTPDERVMRRERQHPIALVLDSWMAIILWAITAVLIVARVIVPDEFLGRNLFGSDTWLGSAAMALTLLTLLGGIAVVAIRWWWWRTQEFIVTNYRLVLAWGVINKTASDSSLEKINDAQLEISWLGRILDYGHLEVLTAAPIQGADMLHRLNHAKDFKKAMMTAKHDLQSNGGSDGEDYRSSARPTPAPAAAPPTPTPAAATTSRIDVSGGDDPNRADTPDEVSAVLSELARLRDAGTISHEEYEAKKSELLGRL